MGLETAELGALAELRFQQRCVERGIECFAPIIATNKAVDFVVRLDGRLVTIQVKKASVGTYEGWGQASPRLTACLHGSAKRRYKTPNYTRADFHAFVCLELNSIWLVPNEDLQVKQTWSKKLSELSTLDPYIF